MQPYYGEQAKHMPPPAMPDYYQNQKPMMPQYYQPAGYQVAPAPMYYQPQQPQEMSVKVEVKSSQINQPQAIIPTTFISTQKTWTHSHHPTEVQCSNCKNIVITIVHHDLGAGSWLMVLLLCCIFWPLVFLPCCVQEMQDVVHNCPVCGSTCGSKKFLC